jgi:S1-C subfamily serine protease
LAAERGHAWAQFNLANFYASGVGVREDDSEAVKWYRKAAEQGHVWSQFNLGVMYANGEGVGKDESEAVRWYRKAAELDHASAQFNLGVVYASGTGVLQSGAAAADWYYKAGLAYLKEGRKEDALLCVERIRNLEAVLHLTVPNLFLADDLLGRSYGSGETPSGDTSSSAHSVSFGTGWVTAEGYVVTNFHVVDGHQQFTLFLDNGTELTAERFLADPANDLVLLKVGEPGSLPAGLPLSADEPDSGTAVFSVGYPHPTLMGAEAKLTDGIINARSGLGGDVRWYQMSVPVQAGNSGGPLINMRGEVVGIVVAKIDAQKVFQMTGDLPENVNFAVKVGYLRPLLAAAASIRTSRALGAREESLVNLSKRIRPSVVLVLAR